MTINFSKKYSAETVATLLDHLQKLSDGTLVLSGRASKDIFKADGPVGARMAWAAIWSLLGETLGPVSYAIKDAGDTAEPTVLAEQVFRFAGSEERQVWAHLDGPQKALEPEARGKLILRTVVSIVRAVHREQDALFVDGNKLWLDAAPLDEKSVEQSKKVVELLRWRVAEPVADLLGGTWRDGERPTHVTEAFDSQANKDAWMRGVLNDKLPIQGMPALAHIAERVAAELMPTSAYSAELPDADPLAAVYDGPSKLPADLAAKFFDRRDDLLVHKKSVFDDFGYTGTGIADNGTTELDRLAFEVIFGPAENKESILVFAPTSSGKTRFAQFAVLEAVTRKKEKGQDSFGCVIVLAPTKALVNQIARDYRRLLRDTASQDWVVIEGTRDHPQYNDHLRSARFDIAVVIPEKLSSMMQVGLSLQQCPLIVVDEFQHLVDGQRGIALEMLMMDAFARYPGLRWVALSASLGYETRDTIRRWLLANGISPDVREAASRLVPLTLRAVSKQKDVCGTNGTPVGSPRNALVLNTDGVINNVAQDIRRYERALDVLFTELTNNFDGTTMPSILVFVHGKSVAVQMAAATRILMIKHFKLDEISKRADPFGEGRFDAFPAYQFRPDVVAELVEDFGLMSPSRLKDQVSESIRHGVGFHTATLNSEAREVIEQAFTMGFIRILFATDTLKLGVNLPSDIVINGEMFRNAGDHYNLLDKDTVIQRLGRAGRYGFKSEGVGVLVVPDTFPPAFNADRLEILQRELEGLGGEQQRESQVHEAVTDAYAVFGHYLADWTGGAEYTPPSDDTWILNAILRMVVGTTRQFAREDLVARSVDLHRRSLACAGGQTVDPALIDELLQHETMAVTEDGSARATRLGWSMASNSVSIENTAVVRDLAEAARSGAGPLTLLYIACTAPMMDTTVSQMRCGTDAKLSIVERIHQLAKDAAGLRRADTPSQFQHFSPGVVDALGSGIHAERVRALIDNPVVSGGPDVTALWRAVILTKWWTGAPMHEIDCAVNGDPRWLVDEVVVHQLAEAASYLLAAAADLEGISPADMTFRTLQRFSSEIEIGLPTVFAALLRLNHRTMNRHRLIGLIPYLSREDLVWDHLDELLRVYAQETGGIPQNTSKQRKFVWAPLSDAVLETISTALRKSENDHRELSFIVPQLWSSARVPYDASSPIGEVVTRIRSRVTGADEIADLLEALGFEEGDGYDYLTEPYPRISLHFTEAGADEHTTYIEVAEPDAPITHAVIDERIASLGERENCIIIDTGGCSHGVIYRSDFHSDKCVVIHPNLFVEMIARVYQANLDEETDEHHFDSEQARALMGALLLNSAPVLNRTDLENRMARLRVV